jgi:hypothetical protein
VAQKKFEASVNNYQLLDATRTASIMYYRLKMVDKDGSFSFSKVITLKLRDEEGSMLLYPSPATTAVTVQIKAETSADAALFILNISGKIVQQKQLTLRRGDNAIVLQVGQIAPGSYIVKLVKKDGTIHTHRLQIMRK